jgi:hypothetical protein
MCDEIQVGDRVQVFLSAKTWGSEGWLDGTVVRIEPYSRHRSFYWVELDAENGLGRNAGPVSVLNPKNIRKI